jgi:hypothetical protein
MLRIVAGISIPAEKLLCIGMFPTDVSAILFRLQIPFEIEVNIMASAHQNTSEFPASSVKVNLES